MNGIDTDPVAAPKRLGPLALGFLGGIGFGLLTLLTSLPEALLVLGTGLVGLLLGLGLRALSLLDLDLRGAFDALLRK